MPLTHWDLILRIAVGAILGGLIGYERDRHRRMVGLRTHLIVSMASATFMVVSSHFYFFQGYGESHNVEVDASRIAASVVTGIGFLAGGSILKTGATVKGLTTAAGLWLVTAIGLCAGSGMFIESTAVTGMGLVALTILRRFENKDDKLLRRHVVLELMATSNNLSEIIQSLVGLSAVVSEINYKKNIQTQKITADFFIRVPKSVSMDSLIQTIEKHEGLLGINIS